MIEHKNLPSKIAAQDVVAKTTPRGSLVVRGLLAVQNSKQADTTDSNIAVSAKEQFRVGMMYFRGKGVPLNYEEAEKWFRLAAEQGDAFAQYKLGDLYEHGVESTSAREESANRFLERLNRFTDEHGIARPENKLVQMSHNDHGVPQDIKEAMKWYRLAAEQGNPNAQQHLGDMYCSGKGVPQDDEEAAKWYRLVAEYGFASAQRMLGHMYQTGRGVAQDYEEAVKWYLLAALQGNVTAQEALKALEIDWKK